MTIKALLPVFGLLLAVAGLACASDTGGSTPPGGNSATQSPSSTRYNSFLGATEFLVGDNRFPFALVSMNGEPLADAQVTATFRQAGGDRRFTEPSQYREIRGVTPHLHPDGGVHEHLDVRGIYVVDGVFFDTPGNWVAEFDIVADGVDQPVAGELGFQVKAQSQAPQVGQSPPATRNPTLRDVADPAEIDSHVPPYPPMHEMTVEEALGAGKPFMVVWSTPMFCISQICGPITDVAIEMHKRYGDRMNFIHIEPWDLKTARTEGRLVPTQLFLEWNLPTEPWVFVVGKDGKITARYEGIVANEEIEGSIQEALLAG